MATTLRTRARGDISKVILYRNRLFSGSASRWIERVLFFRYFIFIAIALDELDVGWPKSTSSYYRCHPCLGRTEKLVFLPIHYSFRRSASVGFGRRTTTSRSTRRNKQNYFWWSDHGDGWHQRSDRETREREEEKIQK